MRDVGRRGGAANPDAVCTATLGKRSFVGNRRRRPRVRRRNPVEFKRYLIAARRGSIELYYNGTDKFTGSRAKGRGYVSRSDAESASWLLRSGFAGKLKGYTLSVVAA